jgi:hypothetical protein
MISLALRCGLRIAVKNSAAKAGLGTSFLVFFEWLFFSWPRVLRLAKSLFGSATSFFRGAFLNPKPLRSGGAQNGHFEINPKHHFFPCCSARDVFVCVLLY